MNEISILLKTGGHCIQTSAKNEFSRITDFILNSMDETVSPEVEYKLELLRDFLETSDFNNLRASDKRLSGITEGTCILSRGEDGKPAIKITD